MAINFDKIRANLAGNSPTVTKSTINWDKIRTNLPKPEVKKTVETPVVFTGAKDYLQKQANKGQSLDATTIYNNAIKKTYPAGFKFIPVKPEVPTAKSMTFPVGEGLDKTSYVKPGPRLSTLEAIKAGDKIVTVGPNDTEQLSSNAIAQRLIEKTQQNKITPAWIDQTPTEKIQEAVTLPFRWTVGYATRFLASATATLNPEKLNPEFGKTRIAQLLFGEESLKPIGEDPELFIEGITKDLTQKGGEKLGLNKNWAKNIGLGAALVVGAIVENPAFGVGKKGAEKVLAKALEKQIAEQTGEKVTKEISQKLLQESNRILLITDKTEKETAINELMSSYSKSANPNKIQLTTNFNLDDLTDTNTLKAQYEGETMEELRNATAGKRNIVGSGTETRVISNKSTFPSWIPEPYRKNSIIQPVLDHIVNGTLPTSKPQREFYDLLRADFDSFGKEVKLAQQEIDVANLDFSGATEALARDEELLKKYEQTTSATFKSENLGIEATAPKVEEIKIPKTGEKLKVVKKPPVASFELPEETRLRYIQRQLQDKMNRVGLTQKEITKQTGRNVDEAADAYMREQLYSGRTMERIKEFDNGTVDDFIKTLKDNDISLDDLGDYLTAKHAAERNTHVQSINKNFKEGGSGLTDKQAAEILAKNSNRSETMDKVAQQVYDIIKAKNKLAIDYGLESAESVAKMESYYKNYVPLKNSAEAPEQFSKSSVGKGFSIGGKENKAAKGRESRAFNPVVQALIDYEDTIIRGEKNKVGQSFKKLVEENPNPDLWNITKLQYTPHYNQYGELLYMDPKYKFADNVIMVKENGDTFLIDINKKEKGIYEAMKNIGVEKSYKVLTTVNNYLRSINTVLNPEFIITNFERDLQTALINLTAEDSAKMAAKVASDIPAAMKGIWKNVRSGDTTNEWAKIYQELKMSGGKMGYFERSTVESKSQDLVKKIKNYNNNSVSSNASKVIKSIGDYIESTNEVVEMAVRTSAYKNAIDNGISKDKAAQLAKNLTVNFNTKGNWSQALNSMYLFFNAGVQGSTRVIRAIKTPVGRKIAIGIVGAGLALDRMNRAINEDEYNKVSDQEKNRKMVFMLPNGNHFGISMPYGYNVFKGIGDIIGESISGRTTPVEGATRVLSLINDSFNPLQSGSIIQMMSPTLTDPVVQVLENKSWFGSPIKPDQPQFGPRKKESDLFWSTVRPESKAITTWLNDITGGNLVESGAIDVSPEMIDNFYDNLTGGTGKFLANSLTTGISVAKGDMPKLQNIPFVRQVYSTSPDYYNSQRISEIRDKSGTKKLNNVEIQDFVGAIKERLQNGEIDSKEAEKTIKEVLKGQIKIKLGEAIDSAQSKK